MNSRLTAEQIFHAAREKPDSAGRAGYLDGVCGRDAALRAKVEALLKADAEAGSFLKSSASAATDLNAAIPQTARAVQPRAPIPPSEQAGEMIGRYKLLQSIGEGGFGSVWMAEQREPVKRRVALKIIRLGMDTRQVITRFEAERQALAMMDHPNIARVLDAGSTETGRPYFVMEYINGVPILEYCDNRKLDTKARLELFSQVCHAIQHAHQKGIIHRDVKPSNVLVTMHDGIPVPKVIDFGIAKATSAELTTKTLFTEHRQMIGTPAYMSPEQAEMSGLDIDTRSDIYSLGVLLYELLTGTTPFAHEELTSKGFAEMMRIIREVEPHKPSTRLSSLGDTAARTAQQRHAVDIKTLGLILRGDLDWIVMKCLEKDRRRRYETANSLAADIKRHLHDEPVTAGAPSAGYKLRKFVRRNRRMVIAGSVVVATLVTGIVGTTAGFIQARSAWIDADRKAEQARAAGAVALREKTVAQHQAYSANMLGASDALERGQIDAARHYLNSAPADLRGWEWRHLSSRLDVSLRVHNQKTRITQLHVAPDGRSYYGVTPYDPERTVQRWDIETGRLLQTIPSDRPCWKSWLIASGKQLMMHLSDSQWGAGTVEVWDLEHGARISSRPVPNMSQPAPGGSLSAYVWQDKIHLMDLRTGAVRLSPPNPSGAAKGWGSSLCFQPDGRRLAVEWSLGQVRLVDADSLQVQSAFEAHDNAIWAMAFSPDGARLATASADGTVRVTDVAANPPVALATLRGHAGFVLDVCFSPDGSLVASRGQDRTVRLWDVRTGGARGVFQTAGDEAGPTAFLPDGQTLISADDNGTVHFWDVRSADAWILRGHRSYVYPVLLSPDGATAYSGGWDGFVGQAGCLRIWDAATGDPIAATGAADTYVVAAALSSDGSRLALSSVVATSARIEVLDTATGAGITSIPKSAFEDGHQLIGSLALDPSGRRLVWVNGRGLVIISDTQTGATLTSRRLSVDPGAVTRVAWSPDGAIIATCDGFAGTLSLWDGHTLEPVRQWPLGHRGKLCTSTFSPDSHRIVTAAENGIARVWDVATGAQVHELIGHGNRVLCAAFSPDGKRIATGGNDNSVRLWDAQTFEPVARLGGHEDYVYSLAWRHDSQQLVSGSGDHTVRIWDTQPMSDRMQARRERQTIRAQVEPLVQRLFSELGDAARVAENVKADATRSQRARRVALQVVLATAIKGRSSTSARSGPANVPLISSSGPATAEKALLESRGTPASAARRYRCSRAVGEIAVDGRLDEASWKQAPWTNDFVDIEGAAKPHPRLRTRARMLWDDRNLYIGAELEEPHVSWTLTQHDDIVYNDNDFEIFIDPEGDTSCYFEFEINAANTVFDLVLTKSYRNGGKADHNWNAAGFRSAVDVDGAPNDPSDSDRGWSVEFAIPWSALAADCSATPPPNAGDVWRLNFSRVEWRHEIVDGAYRKPTGIKEDNWVWSPQYEIDMHIPERWGYLEFVGAPANLDKPAAAGAAPNAAPEHDR